MSTDAKREGNKRYHAKMGRITLRPAPELVEQIKAHAAARGESVQGFMIRAARETMDRE